MESVKKEKELSPGCDAYGNIRMDCYALLASLLGQAPSEELLYTMRNLAWDGAIPEGLDRALGALCEACDDYPPAAVEEEFNRLFVGLGRGEIIPYASWYREKKIQSRTLAALRSDLMPLGIVRRDESHESEDHAGVLCEIMALISRQPDNIPGETQARFFHRHLAPWMATFFQDLRSAESSDFYRLVGVFGGSFLEAEREYLKQDNNA